MGTLDQAVPTAGPLTAVQLSDEINTEYAELYKRSLAVVGSPAGTNAYTGSIPLNRTLEDGNGFVFRVPNTNTAACTFNGKPLVTNAGAALQAGQLTAGSTIVFLYDIISDSYRIQSPLTSSLTPIVRVYSASTTWTKPAGLQYIKLRIQANSGYGANGNSAGDGGYGERLIAASALPATVEVRIDPRTYNLAPQSGGQSSFGSVLVCQNGGSATSTLDGVDGQVFGADFFVNGGYTIRLFILEEYY